MKIDSYSFAVFNKSDDDLRVVLDLSKSKNMLFSFEKGKAVKVVLEES